MLNFLFGAVMSLLGDNISSQVPTLIQTPTPTVVISTTTLKVSNEQSK